MDAEIARSEERDDTVALLDRVTAEFRAGGWMQQVARMQLSRWLAAGRGRRPPKELVQRCIRNGYGLELTALQAEPAPAYIPLHPL